MNTNHRHHRAQPSGAPAAATQRSMSEHADALRAVNVQRAHDGGLRHGRCGRDLDYRGSLNGGRELAFYCQTCYEHVTLPQFVVARLLQVMAAGPDAPRAAHATVVRVA